MKKSLIILPAVLTASLLSVSFSVHAETITRHVYNQSTHLWTVNVVSSKVSFSNCPNLLPHGSCDLKPGESVAINFKVKDDFNVQVTFAMKEKTRSYTVECTYHKYWSSNCEYKHTGSTPPINLNRKKNGKEVDGDATIVGGI